MDSKLIICVKSCRDSLKRGDHDVIRATWGREAKAWGINVTFFVGGQDYAPKHHGDEVYLGVADDYNSLPMKTRKICQWASAKVFDYIFMADTDTYIDIPKLLQTGFEHADYAGKISKPVGKTFRYEAIDREGNVEVHDKCYPWASGGYGYFLSRKAVFEVSNVFPNSWAEDLWVGQVMGGLAAVGEITIKDLPIGYSDHFPATQFGEGYDPKFRWLEKKYMEAK